SVIAGVDPGHEQSVAPLPGRTVATEDANSTCDRLLDFKSARHHRLHSGRLGLRHRFARRENTSGRLSGARRFGVAVCATAAQWTAEGAYTPRPSVQFIQAIFRREISFVSPHTTNIIERTRAREGDPCNPLT